MEQTKTFQDLLREGSFTVRDALLGSGVAMVVIGVIAILAPFASGILLNMLFGAVFIAAGVVELADAFRAGTWQRGVLLGLLGIVTVAAGALYISRPVVGLVVLTVVFLSYLVFAGVFRIVMAFAAPRGAPGKVLGAVSGIVALVLAYLALGQMPNISMWLIGTFLGVSFIFAGAARISLSRGFRKAADQLGGMTPHGAHA
jgi:uncharacterized membrane protein HdeD (DUF308 family)